MYISGNLNIKSCSIHGNTCYSMLFGSQTGTTIIDSYIDSSITNNAKNVINTIEEISFNEVFFICAQHKMIQYRKLSSVCKKTANYNIFIMLFVYKTNN